MVPIWNFKALLDSNRAWKAGLFPGQILHETHLCLHLQVSSTSGDDAEGEKPKERDSQTSGAAGAQQFPGF